MHHPDVQRVLSPAFLVDRDEAELDVLYDRRAELHAVEGQVSYVRRVVQARIEILCAELERREGGGDPADLSELVRRLPDVLGGNESVPSTRGGPDLEPDPSYVAHVDAVVGPQTLLGLPDHSSTEIDSQVMALEGLETLVSRARRDLHERIDQIQCEIARRFKATTLS